MAASAAYLIVKSEGWNFTFDGVVSVTHSLTLKTATDSESSEDSDYVNNARNEPDTVTLAVVASDAAVAVKKWSASCMRSLASIKENRTLCKVVTTLRTYDNMLLTELNIVQDETCPCGWTGTLTFTHSEKPKKSNKENDRSSTPESLGTQKPVSITDPGGDSKYGLLQLFRNSSVPVVGSNVRYIG